MAPMKFNEIEIDAIGEIMNISLGASATAISNMLGQKVDISIPRVSVITKGEFSIKEISVAVGIEIEYVEGLEGKNTMLINKDDVRKIVEILLGMDINPEEFELDELNKSAICEVMNQMMGASATALSDFLSKTVNISTPRSFEITDEEQYENSYFTERESVILVQFDLTIADRITNTFMNVLYPELAKDLLRGFIPPEMMYQEGDDDTEGAAPPVVEPVAAQPELIPTPQPVPEPVAPTQPVAPEPAVAAQPVAIPQPVAQVQPAVASSQDLAFQNQLLQTQQQMMQQMQQMMQQMQSAPAEPQVQNKTIYAANSLHQEQKGSPAIDGEQKENLELVMGVPLDVSVEIGRTQSQVKEILSYSKGTLVVLDKQAGDQVDLFVNGQCIAKGDVVVVDDNFGIRITEILRRPEL